MDDNALGSFTLLYVRDLMNTQVKTVSPDDTLLDAIGLMVRHSIRHLPVVDGAAVVGVLSDRNVRTVLVDGTGPEERRAFLRRTPVSERASTPVSTVGPDDLVSEVARRFVEDRIGCLPVVDEGGVLIGILTQTDLLDWLSRAAD
jgi:acetoin utilization protein AcuB